MVERMKSAVIVALCLSLVALLGLSFSLGVYGGKGGSAWMLSALFSRYAAATPQTTPDVVPQPAAWPAQVSVVGETGVFTAAGESEYAALYSPSSPVWGVYQQSLGSSGTPEETDQAAFMALLEAPAVCLRFDTALPLWLHHAWVEGESDKPDIDVRAVAIGVKEDAVALGVATFDGRYYSLSTGTSVQDLAAACQTDAAANSFFAAGKAPYDPLAPYEIIYTGTAGTDGVSGLLALPAYRVSSTVYTGEGRLPRQVLEALSLRYYLSSAMVSAGGALRYVDGLSELTASADGSLQLARGSGEERLTAGLAPGSRDELIWVVEYARDLVNQVWRVTESFGQLSLDLLSYNAQAGRYTIGFELRVGGLYVQTPERPAYVVIESGQLAALGVRPCTATAEGPVLIPYLQYAAAAQGSGGLGVCYLWRGPDSQADATAELWPQVSMVGKE